MIIGVLFFFFGVIGLAVICEKTKFGDKFAEWFDKLVEWSL
jgi:hypothetical protein